MPNIFLRATSIAALAFLLTASPSAAQIVNDMDDETRLYAQSKQVNQFFRRFNGEEDEKGNRYYPKDKQYRSARLRKKFLATLFDEENPSMTPELKAEFARAILEKPESTILDFHGKNWFPEIRTVFTMAGKNVPVTLYMKLERAQLGSKWVIEKIYADIFRHYFVRDTVRVGRFLHPMSHELDFMNLRKALANTDSLAQFTTKNYSPDYLSLFLYEVGKGNLRFKSVEAVRFHFFQIPGWYFEIAEFNRPGYNTGWLISNLVRINNPSEEAVLRKYLYNETR